MSKETWITMIALVDRYRKEGDIVHFALLPKLQEIADQKYNDGTVVIQPGDEDFKVGLGHDIHLLVDHNTSKCKTCEDIIDKYVETLRSEEDAMHEFLEFNYRLRKNRLVLSNPRG